MAIRFGTDGWRAVIGEDFTFENVRHVTQAIADYLHISSANATGPVVVGYDTRFLSDRFAQAVAEVLAGNDLCVILSRADCPTPVASHAVRALRGSGGVMITASHNPPRYSGLKFKGPSGASATASETRKVEERLAANLAAGRAPRRLEYKSGVAEAYITRLNFFPLYLEQIRRLVDLQAISEVGWRVVVDPMYGAGRGYLRSILTAAGCEVLEIRGELNPGFGGIHPEPIEEYLAALVAAVRDHRSDVGLATDGDADRIGAMDQFGCFVSPQVIFGLVLRYLVETRGWSGAVVKSVSTSQIVNALAGKYSLPVYETPVGFNHIADLMQTHDVLIGGEESGGITIRGHVPMGDGILMGLMLLEIMSQQRMPLHKLVESLMAEFGPFYYARNDLRTGAFSKQALVEELIENAPPRIADLRVVGVKNSDGVKYLLDDDGWLLIRPSGTEPLLRVYAEGRSPEKVKELLESGVRLFENSRAADSKMRETCAA